MARASALLLAARRASGFPAEGFWNFLTLPEERAVFGVLARAVNSAAEAINVPSAQASMPYSGQCCSSARIMLVLCQEAVGFGSPALRPSAMHPVAGLCLDERVEEIRICCQRIHASII